MNSQRLTLPERGQLSMSYFPCTTNKTQQNSIEVEIETKKSHKKHFETKVKELQDTIRKAEREHENMKKLVRVRISLIRLHIPELGHVGHMNSFFFLSVAVIYITSVCYLRKTVLWCGSSKEVSFKHCQGYCLLILEKAAYFHNAFLHLGGIAFIWYWPVYQCLRSLP